jgi:hypothetical protein
MTRSVRTKSRLVQPSHSCLSEERENNETTYLEEGVPRTSAKGHAVLTDAQTRDSVLVTGEDSHTFSLQSRSTRNASVSDPRHINRMTNEERWTVHTLRVSQTLQLLSSYPAKRILPDAEKATEVMPHRMLSWTKELSSRSARRSKSLHEASSDPVAKASPLGKNLRQGKATKKTEHRYVRDKA